MQTGVHGVGAGKAGWGVEGLSDPGAFRGALEAASSLMAPVLNPPLALLLRELLLGSRVCRVSLRRGTLWSGGAWSGVRRQQRLQRPRREGEEAEGSDPGPSLVSTAVCGASYFNLCPFSISNLNNLHNMGVVRPH